MRICADSGLKPIALNAFACIVYVFICVRMNHDLLICVYMQLLVFVRASVAFSCLVRPPSVPHIFLLPTKRMNVFLDIYGLGIVGQVRFTLPNIVQNTASPTMTVRREPHP